MSSTSKQPSTPKGRIIIHCIRHAESYCNLPIPDPGRLRNPPLTPKGISQAQALSKHFPHQRTINAVLCSPLQRTLETALTALDSSAPPFKIIAYPNLREYGRCAGNTGAGLAELKEEMDVEGKRERVDLGLVGEGWEKELDTSWKEMRERARRVRQELWELGCMVMGGGEGMWKGIEVGGRESEEGSKQVEIVVVSHGTFLSELVRTAKGKGQAFWNAEIRSYELVRLEQGNWSWYRFEEFRGSRCVEHRSHGMLTWEIQDK